MQRLVDQMLLLTRTDEGAVGDGRREVDLDDLARTETARLRNGLVIDTSQVGDGRVLGDELALGQVVRNLLDNAARHARGAGRGGRAPDGASAVFTVDDDGAGVPEDQRERVFERFVRLDEARARDDGGSGLGLAIVREITRAHGGEAVGRRVRPWAEPGSRWTLRAVADPPEGPFRCVQVGFSGRPVHESDPDT